MKILTLLVFQTFAPFTSRDIIHKVVPGNLYNLYWNILTSMENIKLRKLLEYRNTLSSLPRTIKLKRFILERVDNPTLAFGIVYQ